MQDKPGIAGHEMFSRLDDRERELLQLLARGMNTSEISKYLSISYQETANISRSIKQKLNVSSIDELKKIIF